MRMQSGSIGVDRADAHQRGDDRDAERFRELAQRARRFAGDHAAARVDERTLRFADHLEEARGFASSTARLASSFMRRR